MWYVAEYRVKIYGLIKVMRVSWKGPLDFDLISPFSAFINAVTMQSLEFLIASLPLGAGDTAYIQSSNSFDLYHF